jgi:hypothetical protein
VNINEKEHIVQATQQWLDDVVIGLNLCPFARKPRRAGQVRFVVSEAEREEELLLDIERELNLLDVKSTDELETTLVVVPNFLSDFWDYNQFIEWVEALVKRSGWEGVYQIATFHPDYCFAGTEPEAPENLTNRSPYPIFHLIREASMEAVLERYPDPESIPENNMARVSGLTEAEKRKLFPYLL